MNEKVPIHSQILILVLFFAACKSENSTPGGAEYAKSLESQGLSFPIVRDFTVKDTARLELKGHQVSRAALEKGSDSIEVKVIADVDDAAAEKMIGQRVYQIQSIFDEHKMPYPGEISDAVTCRQEFLPVIKKESSTKTHELKITLNANARKVVGVCDSKDVAYRSLIKILHCRAKKVVFDIQAYGEGKKPAGELEKSLGEISCL